MFYWHQGQPVLYQVMITHIFYQSRFTDTRTNQSYVKLWLLKYYTSHVWQSLFNKSLSDGKVPSAWKIAKVRLIFKKGSRSDPGNYRPVSLTSVVSKLFETFFRDALYDHLVQNDLLSKDQFGFYDWHFSTNFIGSIFHVSEASGCQQNQLYFKYAVIMQT